MPGFTLSGQAIKVLKRFSSFGSEKVNPVQLQSKQKVKVSQSLIETNFIAGLS